MRLTPARRQASAFDHSPLRYSCTKCNRSSSTDVSFQPIPSLSARGGKNVSSVGGLFCQGSFRSLPFGLRMALGAMPAAIRRLTLARTTRLTLAGVACGLGISLILGQILKGALYLV